MVLRWNMRRQVMAVKDLRRYGCYICAVRSMNYLLLHLGMGRMMMRTDICVAWVKGMRMRMGRWHTLAVRLVHYDIRILSIGAQNKLCRRCLHVMGMLRRGAARWVDMREPRLLRKGRGRRYSSSKGIRSRGRRIAV